MTDSTTATNCRLNFEEALTALRNGQRVTRAGWNGVGMWLTLVAAKEHGLGHEDPGGSREHLPYIGIKTADNKFVPWVASHTDLLAEDWGILGLS